MEDKYLVLTVLSVPLLVALFILCSGKNPVCIKLKLRNVLVEVTSKKADIKKKAE